MADIKTGDLAPDFAIPGVVTKPEVYRQEFKLSDYRGKRNVVIAFHSFAFTAT
jgi:peroxiredoxin